MEDGGSSNISKMKVAELKKQLKMKGLAVTGNKNELVERLQEALESGEEVTATGLDSSAVDEEEFDEEEILGDDEVGDLSKITPQEEAAVLGNDTTSIHIKDSSLLMEQSETKKISLKRSEPCLSTPAEISSSTEETTEDTNAKAVEGEENSQTEEIAEPKHKVIKLSDNEQVTPEDRAKKFGTSTNVSSDPKTVRAARFGKKDGKSVNARPEKLSMETGGTDVDKLKKRAERFGEVTSKSLTKLESNEKLKKREDRFGSTKTTTVKQTENTEKDVSTTTPVVKTAAVTAAEEKAAARAIKFGEDKTNGTITKGGDAKAKRAERFSAAK